jgi:hypothetical protein
VGGGGGGEDVSQNGAFSKADARTHAHTYAHTASSPKPAGHDSSHPTPPPTRTPPRPPPPHLLTVTSPSLSHTSRTHVHTHTHTRTPPPPTSTDHRTLANTKHAPQTPPSFATPSTLAAPSSVHHPSSSTAAKPPAPLPLLETTRLPPPHTQSVTPPPRKTSPREILPSVAWLNPTDGGGAESCNNMPSVLQQDSCRSTSLASSCLAGGRKEESGGGWSKGEYAEREGLRHGQSMSDSIQKIMLERERLEQLATCNVRNARLPAALTTTPAGPHQHGAVTGGRRTELFFA